MSLRYILSFRSLSPCFLRAINQKIHVSYIYVIKKKIPSTLKNKFK